MKHRTRVFDGSTTKCRKPGMRHAAWAALVHHGGDAGLDADHVGVQAEPAGDVLIDMGVGIDHAGDDDLAADIDQLSRGIGGQCVLDRGDAAVADGDVGNAVATRRGIDHTSAAQQQIELPVHRNGSHQLVGATISSVC